MTYRDLITSAMASVCEDSATPFGFEDYTSRAPYLLASFVTQYAKLDSDYRKANNMTTKEIFTDMVAVNPEDTFPLCDVFVPAAIYHLASGLVMDENEEMSDKFFDRYIKIILEIRDSMPATTSAIIDRYGL